MEYKYITKPNLSSYLFTPKNVKYIDMLLLLLLNLMMKIQEIMMKILLPYMEWQLKYQIKVL